MTVQVEPLPATEPPIRCHHARCDGRAAKWTFPQTRHLADGQLVCCSVHLARFVEIVIAQHAQPVPITHGRRKQR